MLKLIVVPHQEVMKGTNVMWVVVSGYEVTKDGLRVLNMINGWE